jgi:hypothetical protein
MCLEEINIQRDSSIKTPHNLDHSDPNGDGIQEHDQTLASSILGSPLGA